MRSTAARFLPQVLLAAVSSLPTLAAASEIPLTVAGETDEQRFVRLTAAVEDDPFADNIRDVRTWLIDWAIAAPDITVVVCNTLGPVFDDKSTPNAGQYVVQLMFGNAAFQILHPDRRDDTLAVQTAALESVLRLYDTLLAADPAAAVPTLDDLMAKHASGDFAAAVQPVIQSECIDQAADEADAADADDATD